MVPQEIVWSPSIGCSVAETTVTIIDEHVVVLHVPVLLTKYSVVEEGETVMLVPVPADVPPHELENHWYVEPEPDTPVAGLMLNVVLAPLQIEVTPDIAP